jgi:transposase-like protein
MLRFGRESKRAVRPPYPPEFRAEAIRLIKTSGETIAQIAKDLGVSDQTLRNWGRRIDHRTERVPYMKRYPRSGS